MSVQPRRLADPRNTYYRDDGTPEQRCCRDRTPLMYHEMAWYMYSNIPGSPGPFGTLEQWKEYIRETERINPDEYWCRECETDLEQFANAVDTQWEFLVRGIAGLAAYIPVIGTAVAFILNGAASLAKGESVDQAFVDAVAGSLPGYPYTGMAFRASVAIAQGKEIDAIAIEALPIPQNVKRYLIVACRVARAIAEGQSLTDTALDELQRALPPAGQKTMSLARELAAGKNVGDLAQREGARYLVGASTKEINKYIAQAGYQAALDEMPAQFRTAVSEGVATGFVAAIQQGTLTPALRYTKPAGRVMSNEDRAIVEPFAAQGRAIIDAGATWTDELGTVVRLSDIRNGKRWSTSRYPEWGGGIVTQSELDSEWRYGFDTAIGACQGFSIPGPGQHKIGAIFRGISGNNGFVSGQLIQHERTQQQTFQSGLEAIAMSAGRILSTAQVQALGSEAAMGKAVSASVPSVAAVRSLVNSPAYRWGFDVAVGFTTKGGYTLPGPGQTAHGNEILRMNGGPDGTPIGTGGPDAWKGWLTGQALVHGMNKVKAGTDSIQQGSASFEAGQLATLGLTGSGLPPNEKADVMGIVASNGATRQGAETAIVEKKGFFAKILAFFGL